MDYERLEAIARQVEKWTLDDLRLPLLEYQNSDEEEIDLVSFCSLAEAHFGKNVSSRPAMDNEVLWLPKDFNEDDEVTRVRIKDWFNTALRPHKTRLSIQSHDRCKNDPLRKNIYYKCFRGVKQRASRSNGDWNTPSLRSDDKAYTCNCRIRVTCLKFNERETRARYYIRTSCGQVFAHNDHPRPHKLAYSSKDLPPDIKQLVLTMLTRHCPISVAQTLIEEVTGLDLTLQVVSNLRTKAIQSQFCNFNCPLTNQSTGDELMHFLETSDGLNYYIYAATKKRSKHLIRLRKKRVGKNRLGDNQDRGETVQEPEKSHQQELNEIIDGMQLKHGKYFLVACAWVSELQLEYFNMFQDVIGLDVTFGTNKERRPMFIVVARTSNGSVIPVLHSFLPSQAMWVFQWLFTEALPYLLGSSNLNGIKVVTMDQCSECMDAFHAAKASGVFRNAHLRLCKWHKVNRGYFVTAFKNARGETELQFVRFVANWLYQFTNDVHSKDEEDYSLAQLYKFIDKSEQTSNEGRRVRDSVANEARQFITEKFVPWLPYLSHREFKMFPGGDKADNCLVESENSSMKRDVGGPKPNHRLSVSAHATARHTEMRMDRLKMNADRAVLCSQEEYTGDDNVVGVSRSLQTTVVKRIREMLGIEYDKSKRNRYMEVPRENTEERQVFYVRSEVPREHADKRDPRPLFERTRKVTIQNSNTDKERYRGQYMVMYCDCDFHSQHQIPCEHMLCLLDRMPNVDDLHPRHLLKYEKLAPDSLQYFRECKEQMDVIRDHHGLLLKGRIPFVPPDLEQVNTRFLDKISFFREAYNRIYDSNAAFYGEDPASGNHESVLAQFGLDGDSGSADAVDCGWNCDVDEGVSGDITQQRAYSQAQEKVTSTFQFLKNNDMRQRYLDDLSNLKTRYMSECVSEAERERNANSNFVSFPGIEKSRSVRRFTSSPSKKRKKDKR